MKVAISSSGRGLDSIFNPRFGRCEYFVIIDTDDMRFEVFENESRALGGGAGIQSAQFITSKGAKAVITGNCGPNAVRTLAEAGVELYLTNSGTIKEALEKFKSGELTATTDTSVPDHRDLTDTPAAGRGMGMGGGRGMSGGGGRGMDGRGGRGMGGGRGRLAGK